MPTVEFIFQAALQKHHKDVVTGLLNTTGINGAIISVAFANRSGVNLVEESLTTIGDQADVFIGIRNEISSYQALQALLETGVNLNVVDTGSRSLIFHPKIYSSWTDTSAEIVVGSANLTFSGLTNNIEASLKLDLDLTSDDDLNTLDSIRNGFRDFKMKHPDHVFSIDNEDRLKDLLKEGRISDEARIKAPSGNQKPPNNINDILKTIGTFKIGHPTKSLATTPTPITVKQEADGSEVTTDGYELVWESSPLAERALSIPTGENTNPAGSMLWTQGAYSDIDQRHHFREVIFQELTWVPDTAPRTAHYERSWSDFTIIIKGVNYGIHNLKLSHNTKVDSATYKESNSVSQIHWGTAKSIVAKRDLLGRVLSLYKSSDTVPKFIIEID